MRCVWAYVDDSFSLITGMPTVFVEIRVTNDLRINEEFLIVKLNTLKKRYEMNVLSFHTFDDQTQEHSLYFTSVPIFANQLIC